MPIIEAVRTSKNYGSISVDGVDFCTIHGSDWRKKFDQLKQALELLYAAKNLPKKDIDQLIKEIKK